MDDNNIFLFENLIEHT